MKKDITKKFLGKENRYASKMLSKDVFTFISRKKINRGNQISIDEIGFKNIFSIEFTNLNTKNILKNGDKIREILSENGNSIEFNMICCIGDESHSDFLLGEIEVSQELYELVMGYNHSWFKGNDDSSQRPVERVTWYDAIMFCNELSILMRKSPYYDIKIEKYHNYSKNIKEASVKINKGANGFRLPLSKEWLYAARAGTNNQWSGTNDKSKLGEYAWFVDNSDYETHPVATKKPNEWGIYDMSGNVNEWCWDKVVVGGSITNKQNDVMINFFNPNVEIEMRMTDVGFRVARNTND